MNTIRTTILLLFPFLIASASAQVGIASHYAGDRGINYDPDVLFADDFESYTSPTQLRSNWNGVYQLADLRIATEAGHHYAGAKAVEMTLPISGKEISKSLNKNLIPAQDVVFLRAYTKFDAGYEVHGGNHDGLRLSAHYPGPGIKPPANGTGFFLFTLQNNIGATALPGETTPGYSHIYAYWPKQRSAYGDHWYPDGRVKPYSPEIGNQGEWLAFPNQYPHFTPMPNFLPQRNRWYCYELMVKANTPGQHNGEVKYWIDGKVVGDFPDLNLRSIDSLKIDVAKIGLQAQHSERINKKWYDDVVVAKKYIGPMTPLRP